MIGANRNKREPYIFFRASILTFPHDRCNINTAEDRFRALLPKCAPGGAIGKALRNGVEKSAAGNLFHHMEPEGGAPQTIPEDRAARQMKPWTPLTQEEALDRINGLLKEKGYSEASAKYNYEGGSASGIRVQNSHTVRSSADRMEICRVLEQTEGAKRSAGNLSAEWAGHNFVFRLFGHNPEVGSADLEFARDKRGVIRSVTAIMDFLGLH